LGLIEKIRAHDVNGAKFIIEKKPEAINQINENNETPLSAVVETGNEEIFNLLMQNHVDLNKANAGRFIDIALDKNHDKLAISLFENVGYTKEEYDQDVIAIRSGWVVKCAIKVGHIKLIEQVLKMLHGNVKEEFSYSLSHAAATCGQIEVLKMFLNFIPIVSNHEDLLHDLFGRALENNKIDTAKFLIEKNEE